MSSLTIKVGSAFLPKEGEWREPIPLGYGFYLCGVETNKDEDYYKVHEPWKPNTVNGDSLFRLCDWLREWDFAMPMLENGRYMFSGTYMRKFRDPSIWHTALSRLSDGEYMFDKCSLDLESIRIIATQVPDWSQDLDTQHKLHLGIDYNIQGDTQLQEYLDLLVTKGWVLTITYLNLGY